MEVAAGWPSKNPQKRFMCWGILFENSPSKQSPHTEAADPKWFEPSKAGLVARQLKHLARKSLALMDRR
jgi:hypothetical protein